MFWKRDKKISLKSWPLATKLKFLHGISLIAILSTLCLFIYSATFADIINSQQFKNNHPQGPYTAVQCFMEAKIALLLSAIGAIVLGNIIARNAMLKINKFTNSIEKISEHALHARINPNEYPQELKNLSEKFNTMLDGVHASFIQLSQFSSDLAHELRNPINNLRLTTEVALSKEQSTNEYVQILESNMEEFHYLSKLVENLLFLARSNHHDITVHKQEINARIEIFKILEYFQIVADDKHITMTCRGDATIIAEPLLFKRIINNLLSNALRYTPNHGTVEIVLNKKNNQTTLLSIIDSGIGIEAKHLPRIFDRFYRVDASRSSLSGGCGLGLAIVKSIVDLHNGDITIESTPNIGTTIHISLPSAH